jgi:predicted NACHT family NTPase
MDLLGTNPLEWDWTVAAKFITDALESEASKALDAGVALAARQAKDVWAGIKWSRKEDQYRQRLLPFVQTTRLLGNPKPVDIDQLYTDLLVYDRVSALRRTRDLVDPRADWSTVDGRERRKARDVVSTGQNLYLLGHPGAGKTTFLRYLAILCCKGIMGRVPVYLQLRDVARSYQALSPATSQEANLGNIRSLVFDSIVNEFAVCELPDARRFVEALFVSGNSLVLIDGLDEVPSADGMRFAIIDSIRDLERRYPKIQICVTCRIAASDYTFEHFAHAEVAPFTEEQQLTFIRKWYTNEEEKRKRIINAWSLDRSRSLRDLGRTPLLLALICLAFDDLNELPDRHVDLYREALEALLKRWDSSRSIFRDPFYSNLNPHRREQLMQEIAATQFQRDKITFSAQDLEPTVEAWFSRLPDGPRPHWSETPVKELLDQIEAQHGLIIQRSRDVYSFAHLSIQEFFCAKSISEGHPGRELEAIVNKHIFDDRWREVIVFCAGLLQDGTRLLEMLVKALAQLLNRTGTLRSFLMHVSAEYQAKGYSAVANHESAVPIGRRTPRAIALDIVSRLQNVAWAGTNHALYGKAGLAAQLLLDAEIDPSHPFADLAKEGSDLATYMQAVKLIVDCACVATCLHRDRIVAPLLTNIRS